MLASEHLNVSVNSTTTENVNVSENASAGEKDNAL
jgi:hypothetical protein